ncbi:Uncharacterised protein [Pseudomonas fluorescens]|uniref:Uncharacterized protein n=1 Tax=Pseudomonas fluorescens TaxID=294 RepID=A0A448E3I3_PSEFL|nr:hypothetical protein [Pseudomonas fluorescens]VEF13598.1 Uncharacterised protein [Pseudomonas fluorescens]
MKDRTKGAKLLEIVENHTEALQPAGGLSASQRHFIEIAVKYGKELEPDGWLAGGGSTPKHRFKKTQCE